MAVPMKIPRQVSKLAAVSPKTLVKFTRPFDNHGSTMGYVVDRGPDFFLLALVSDTIHFDGFNCFRHRDLRRLEIPAKYAAFVESALNLRGERVPHRPRINLNSTSEMIRSAGLVFPLVTIHREKVAPDVMSHRACNGGRRNKCDPARDWARRSLGCPINHPQDKGDYAGRFRRSL